MVCGTVPFCHHLGILFPIAGRMLNPVPALGGGVSPSNHSNDAASPPDFSLTKGDTMKGFVAACLLFAILAMGVSIGHRLAMDKVLRTKTLQSHPVIKVLPIIFPC